MARAQDTLVLVVDDEPLIRVLASETLEEAGFEVVEAADADEALAVLRSRPEVGLLFTDINMPGSLDGLQLCEIVHQLWPDIKLVVTSGRGLNRPIPDDGRFLGKPYDLQAMAQLVTEVARPEPTGD